MYIWETYQINQIQVLTFLLQEISIVWHFCGMCLADGSILAVLRVWLQVKSVL